MKVEMKVINAVADVRHFRDNKTGNTQDRQQLTIAGQVGEELVSAVIYLDKSPDVMPSGKIVLDVYRYEATNALMGSIIARNWSSLK